MNTTGDVPAYIDAFSKLTPEDQEQCLTDQALYGTSIIHVMKDGVAKLIAADEFFDVRFVEDWLPLGRGGPRRFYNSVDEYWAARMAWAKLNRHEKEAQLRERERPID